MMGELFLLGKGEGWFYDKGGVGPGGQMGGVVQVGLSVGHHGKVDGLVVVDALDKEVGRLFFLVQACPASNLVLIGPWQVKDLSTHHVGIIRMKNSIQLFSSWVDGGRHWMVVWCWFWMQDELKRTDGIVRVVEHRFFKQVEMDYRVGL